MITAGAAQPRDSFAGVNASWPKLTHNLATDVARPAIRLNHVSHIVYAVPSERAHKVIPAPFDLETRQIAGRECALLTVESFLDRGEHLLPGSFSGGGRGLFEQTNYRFHTRLNGEPCGWLLGTSLGALSAVAARHLWAAPWHLSAMEFQVAYDPLAGCYRHYRLRAQSQWASAWWEINDTGAMSIDDEQAVALYVAVSATGAQTDYFFRRDGGVGCYRVRHEPAYTTRGQLGAARCDLLERLGLLTAQELLRPCFINLQHSVTRVIEATVRPAVITALSNKGAG